MADAAVNPQAEESAARYVSAISDVGAIGKANIFTGAYRRLFAAQVASSTGDWVGFLAVASLASTLGKSNAAVAVSAVLSARILPGFFFGAFATGLIDRWDRKKIMVTCDIGRGLIYAAIPFAKNVGFLILAQVFLELLTLMWTPAKEASVPNLVPNDQLASANSASLAAAYGTILPAVLIFTGLQFVASLLAHVHALRFINHSQQSLAIYLDVISFFVSASIISRLALERTGNGHAAEAATLASTWRDAKEGWRFIGRTYRVRGVMIGFCTALIGGAMTVPLETLFAAEILHKGPTAFGLLATALGFGVAVGVLFMFVLQKRLDHDFVFGTAVLGAGAALLFAASMAQLALVMLGIGALGACAGAVYVTGFTIVGESTGDEMRGRIFGVFYVLLRLCLLVAFTVAPLIAGLLDGISVHFYRTANGHRITHQLGNNSFHVAIPGARLTLWLGGGIILIAGWIARRDLRKA